MSEIKQLASKVVYQNKWMRVREDRIRRANAGNGIYSVVEKADFVVILAVENDDIHLVEQYRYPVKKRYWELPQGSWELEQESDHLQVAKGELQEETGLIAQNMLYVGFQYLAYGYSDQGYHIYLATELEHGSQNLDLEEEGLISKRVKISEFEQMICSGEIKDATTLCAYSLTKMKGFL